MPSIAALRHAPWSLSKVKCALRCPREFEYRYVSRVPEPEVMPDARIGKAVHQALEGVLLGVPVEEAVARGRGELLTDEERRRYDALETAVRSFVGRIDAFRGRRRVRAELVEHRVAVTADLAPTVFHARDAFFRGVWDAAFTYDEGNLAVVDHKTGARRPIDEYQDQLEGYAVLAAAHLAAVRRLWLGVHFVADRALEWAPPLRVDAVRAELAPRLLRHIEEGALAVASGYDLRPSGWCQRCSYRSLCPAGRQPASAGAGG